MNDELYHYGILGMHWGIRRYQPYGEGGYTPKDKNPNIKSESGLTDNQKKALKIGATVAGVSAVTIGAYFCNKYYNMNASTVLKAGKEIQHLGSKIENLNEPFYASYLKKDNIKYLKNRENHWSCKKIIESSSDIKIPSTKECLEIFKKVSNIDNDKNIKQSYKLFMREVGEVFPNEDIKKTFNDFCYELGKRGYSAVRDANDQYNMFNAVSPIIIFRNFDDLIIKKVSDFT